MAPVSNPISINIDAQDSPFDLNLALDLTLAGYQYRVNTSNGPVEVNLDLANGTTATFVVDKTGNDIIFKSPSDIFGLGFNVVAGQSLVLTNTKVGDFITFAYNSGGTNVITEAFGNFQLA